VWLGRGRRVVRKGLCMLSVTTEVRMLCNTWNAQGTTEGRADADNSEYIQARCS
jgi:hypothetical protein